MSEVRMEKFEERSGERHRFVGKLSGLWKIFLRLVGRSPRRRSRAAKADRKVVETVRLERIQKHRAKVLACLQPGYVTVIVGYGQGLADFGRQTEVPMELVPFDLRVPNSEFILVFDCAKGDYVAVERPGDGAAAPRE